MPRLVTLIAAARLAKAAAVLPNNVFALSDCGYALLQQRSFAQAITVLQRAVAADPYYRLAWENLAHAYRGSGNTAEAARCEAEAAKLSKP